MIGRDLPGLPLQPRPDVPHHATRLAAGLTSHVSRWTWCAVFAVLLAGFLRLGAYHGLEPRGTDDQYYFAQARSLVLDGDLDLRNELGELTPRPGNVHLSTSQPWYEPTATGKVPIKYPVGTAVLQAPFLAAAHAAARLMRELGGPLAANGYELPYYLAWGIGTVLWALVALASIRRLLASLLRLGPLPSLLVTGLAFACSPLAYHTMGDPYMAHVPSTALVSVLLLLTLGPTWPRPLPQMLAAGLVAGLAVATRPTDLVWASCLVVPLADGARWRGRPIAAAGLAALGFALGVLPQLLAMKSVHGSFFHYSYGSERFHLPPPYLIENLLGHRAGLFAWNPLWLPALAVALVSQNLPLMARAAAVALVLWNSSWWCHWWGDTFGGRAHASLLPVVAFGLGRIALRARSVVIDGTGVTRALLVTGLAAAILAAVGWTGFMIWRMESLLPQQRAQGADMPYRLGAPSGR
jgi:hypothetical protein